jgi:hypothetical protein
MLAGSGTGGRLIKTTPPRIFERLTRTVLIAIPGKVTLAADELAAGAVAAVTGAAAETALLEGPCTTLAAGLGVAAGLLPTGFATFDASDNS